MTDKSAHVCRFCGSPDITDETDGQEVTCMSCGKEGVSVFAGYLIDAYEIMMGGDR